MMSAIAQPIAPPHRRRRLQRFGGTKPRRRGCRLPKARNKAIVAQSAAPAGGVAPAFSRNKATVTAPAVLPVATCRAPC
jgi:hypothetical protein